MFSRGRSDDRFTQHTQRSVRFSMELDSVPGAVAASICGTLRALCVTFEPRAETFKDELFFDRCPLHVLDHELRPRAPHNNRESGFMPISLWPHGLRGLPALPAVCRADPTVPHSVTVASVMEHGFTSLPAVHLFNPSTMSMSETFVQFGAGLSLATTKVCHL